MINKIKSILDDSKCKLEKDSDGSILLYQGVYPGECFEESLYLIGHEEHLKVSLIKEEDKVSVKFEVSTLVMEEEGVITHIQGIFIYIKGLSYRLENGCYRLQVQPQVF